MTLRVRTVLPGEGHYTEAVDAARQAVARAPGGYEPLLVQGLAHELAAVIRRSDTETDH